MGIWLFVLFVALPILELFLLFKLIALNWQIGLGLILLTGFGGAALARYQGTRAWNRVKESLSEGRIPAQELTDGLLILIAGCLLITPGIITDVVGFLLLLPSRIIVRKLLMRYFKKHLHVRQTAFFEAAQTGQQSQEYRSNDDEIIDVDAEVIEENHKELKP